MYAANVLDLSVEVLRQNAGCIFGAPTVVTFGQGMYKGYWKKKKKKNLLIK